MRINKNKVQLKKIILNTIKVNRMKTDVHVRIIISRGMKSTPYQDPNFTISKPSIVVIPEHKKPKLIDIK